MCSEIYKSYSDWVSFIVNKSLVILRKPWIKDLSYTITLATWWKEPTHWKRTWCCETLKAKGEEAAEDKDSMDMNLSKLWETVKNRGAWHAAVHGVTKSWSLWATHRHTEWITSWPLKLNGEMCVCVCVCVCSVMSDSCNPMDCSPPGSSEHEIFQARILEQVAISFSRGSSRPRDRTLISCVSCAGRRVLYQLSHQGSQWRNTLS